MLYLTNNTSVFQYRCKRWVKHAPSPSSVSPNNMFEWKWNSAKPNSSRPNFAGTRPAIYDSFHWKQAIAGARIPSFVKQIQIWHLLHASPFKLFGLSTLTRCFTKNNGTGPKSNTLFGTTSLCMPRWHERGWVTPVRIGAYSTETLLKEIQLYLKIRTIFVSVNTQGSLGIRNNNAFRLVGTSYVRWVAWGGGSPW